MAPKFKDPEDEIPCSSLAQLAAHIGEMQTMFVQPESEHTWERFGKGLNKLAALTRGGAYKLDNFQNSVGSASQGGIGEKIVQCVLSERAALSKPAVELVTSIAVCLATHFTERLQRLFIPPLLDLIRRTNNIVRERAEHALYNVFRNCPSPPLIGYLSGAIKDANSKLRRSINVAAAIAVEGWKAGGRVEDIEMMIKQLTADKDADVRKAARDLWDKYKVSWPERVLTFIAPMSPTTKKRLDIKDTDTYPLGGSGSFARSPSAPGLASSSSSSINTTAVPAKKMGAKSFIAQRKAELARQAAAARASAASEGEAAPSQEAPTASAQAASASPAPRPETLPPLPPSPPPAARPSTSYLPNFGTDDFTSSPSLLSQLPPLPPSQPSTPQKTPSKSPLAQPSPLAPATPTPIPTPTPTTTAASPVPAAARSTPLRPPRSPARLPSPALDPLSPQTASSSTGAAATALPSVPSAAFSTPLHPASRALRNAAAFQDSPPPPLLLPQRSPTHRDLLSNGINGRSSAREFGAWRKVSDALREGLPSSSSPARPTAEALDDLASLETLRWLVDFSLSHPVSPADSNHLVIGEVGEAPGRVAQDAVAVWKDGALFEDLLEKVLGFLGGHKASPDVEQCLVLLGALIENQWPLFEGHEGPLITALCQLRSIPRAPVRQATTDLFSTASTALSPIFCLYTLSSTLHALLASASPTEEDKTVTSPDRDSGAQGFAFGLLELGRVFMRLPAEVVSEELPRLRDLILPGLYSSLLSVRESAATAVLAAQLVVRDESLVFSLLEGLTSDKINLLTYMFEKNRIREGAGSEGEGRERVEWEMRRLSLHL